MSEYSNIYAEDVKVTYNNVEYSLSQELFNYYNVNDDIDLSCVWAVSDVFNKIYYHNATSMINNYELAYDEKITNIGLTWLYRAVNYANQFVGFQFGTGDVYKSKVRPWGFDTRVIRNLNTVNILGTLSNISGININDGSSRYFTCKEVIDGETSDGLKIENYIVDFYDLTSKIGFNYLKDDGSVTLSRIGLGIVMYGNNDGSPRAIIEQQGITGQYVANWNRNTGINYGSSTSSNDRVDYTQNGTVFMHGMPQSCKSNVETNVNGIFKINDDIYQQSNNGNPIIGSRLYITLSYASKIMASIGVYFDYINPGTNKTIDDRIKDGNVVLGEMLSNGHTTGKWLKTKREIYSAENYEKDTENKELDPTMQPEGDDDELAVQLIGQNSQLAKFMHYYIMNESEIEELGVNIRSALVENPMQYLISLKEIPYYFERFIAGGSVKENIWMGPWEAASATGFRIQSSTAVAIIGSININRYFNNFLDYSPYTNVSLYVPYCGKIELPVDIVMGKNLQIYISFDYESLNCIAMIYSNGAYVTNIHGNIGKDYSVSATNGFLKGLGSALSVFETTALIGASFVNPGFALELPSSVVNTVNSLSKNYSISKESSNDFTNFKAPQQCCLFISRPRLEDLKGFKKSVGVRCEKFGALSTFSGLTVCRNPHINIECTDTEKDMIKQLLENGVIL